MDFETYYRSEIGLIYITGTEEGVTSLNFVEEKSEERYKSNLGLTKCVEQLDEYFRGERRLFSVDLIFQGTPFQSKVWKRLLTIPYGKTVSYRQIARSIGKINAVRAVGNANGKNPISIIVPCHRVIGSDGSLTGYGGGLWRKEWLLDHERAVATRAG